MVLDHSWSLQRFITPFVIVVKRPLKKLFQELSMRGKKNETKYYTSLENKLTR